jgi:rubrerythrin
VSEDALRALAVCREAEKEQALFYRALAAQAEERGDEALSQRFHDLHADEQHHLSRLTARMMELGRQPPSLDRVRTQPAHLDGWETLARRRERDEVRRYEILLAQELDAATRALAEEILEVERRHADELGGKWTMA